MPYRIDLDDPPADAFERLVELGALDVEQEGGTVAALMPEAIPVSAIAMRLGVRDIRVSPAYGRDDESVWMLSVRPVRMRSLLFVPASRPAVPGALRIIDGRAFGTGFHPTTRLCLQLLEDLLDVSTPAGLLDVGTGSGILALAALQRGVPQVVAIDIHAEALRVAAENAKLNDLAPRLRLVRGGPEAVRGSWPVVVANIRAAELMELAPALVRRVASRGRLMLSGIPRSAADEVERVYCRFGMKRLDRVDGDDWTALVLAASW